MFSADDVLKMMMTIISDDNQDQMPEQTESDYHFWKTSALNCIECKYNLKYTFLSALCSSVELRALFKVCFHNILAWFK